METIATQRVREARAGLLLTHPFFGVLSLKLNLEEDESFPTMGVNATTLKFGPEFVAELSNSELKGVIAHEVMHLGLLHPMRQGSREHGLWNQACDYAINPNLIKDGFTLPEGGLIDPRFKNKSADQIYRILESEKQDNQDSQGDSGPNPCGEFAAAGDGTAENGEAERQWEENVQEALRAASGAGKMPAGLKAQIQKALASKADWATLLKRFMHDQVKTRCTWNKRNKRFPDIFLPGRLHEGMGSLVIAVDTSGSIDQGVLNRFAAEISQIIRDVEPEQTHVVYCDTKVNHIDTFNAGEDIRINAVGRGGTAFSPVFERVESEGWQPAALIYLTDLDCDDYPKEPAYPVLWAAYGTQANAPVGETIHIE